MGTRRGDRFARIVGDMSHIGGAAQPAGYGAGHRVDIGFQRRVVLLVMGGMIADHNEHRDMRAPGVMQVRQPVAQARTQVQEHRGGLIGDPGVAVSRPGGHALEQCEDTAHLRHGVQCRNEVHLRGSGVGEADPYSVLDERGDECLSAVHRSDCRASVIPHALKPLRRLVKSRDQLGHDVGDGSYFVHPADDLTDRHGDRGGIR